MKIEIHPHLDEVFDNLEQRGAQWSLLRGESLLSSPEDVDVLIAQEDAGRVVSALEELGFVHLPAWGRGPHQFFIDYDRSSDTFIKIDVVTALFYGSLHEFRSDLGTQCLERRRRNGNLNILHPDDAFWTLLLHCLVDKGYVAPHHRVRLQELASTVDQSSAACRIVDGLVPPSWTTEGLLESITLGRWEFLEALAPSVTAAWSRKQGAAVLVRRTVNRCLRLLTRALLVPRRGVSVALLAPDGGGKSTLTAGLERTFPLPVRTVYMGLARASGAETQYRTKALGTARIFRQWRRYLVGRYHQSRGRLVIFDRYIYDALLPSRRPLSTAKKARRWLLGRLCPSPNLVLLLDAPAEILHRRSGQHTVAFLEQRRLDYLSLEQRVPNLRVLDASRAPDDVRRAATQHVWDIFEKRQERSKKGPRRVFG
jgi:thymidylate kinase